MTNPESDFGLVFFDAYDRTVFVSIVMCTVERRILSGTSDTVIEDVAA